MEYFLIVSLIIIALGFIGCSIYMAVSILSRKDDEVKKDLPKVIGFFMNAYADSNSWQKFYEYNLYKLGLCYEKGEGVEKDLPKAVYWYMKAAEQGDKNAKEALYRLTKNYEIS